MSVFSDMLPCLYTPPLLSRVVAVAAMMLKGTNARLMFQDLLGLDWRSVEDKAFTSVVRIFFLQVVV